MPATSLLASRQAASGDGVLDCGEGVVADEGGDNLYIDTERVHVCQALLRVPAECRGQWLSKFPQSVDQLSIVAAATGDAMPRLPAVERFQHTMRHEVSVMSMLRIENPQYPVSVGTDSSTRVVVEGCR